MYSATKPEDVGGFLRGPDELLHERAIIPVADEADADPRTLEGAPAASEKQ